MSKNDPVAAKRTEEFLDRLVAGITPEGISAVKPEVLEALQGEFKAQVRKSGTLTESALKFYNNLDKVIKPAGSIYTNEAAMGKLGFLAAAELQTLADLTKSPELIKLGAQSMGKEIEVIGWDEKTLQAYTENLIKDGSLSEAKQYFPTIENFMDEASHTVTHTAPPQMQELMQHGFKGLAVLETEKALRDKGMDLQKLIEEGNPKFLAEYEAALKDSGLTVEDIRNHYASRPPVNPNAAIETGEKLVDSAAGETATKIETDVAKEIEAAKPMSELATMEKFFDRHVAKFKTALHNTKNANPAEFAALPEKQRHAIEGLIETFPKTERVFKKVLPLEEISKLPIPQREKHEIIATAIKDASSSKTAPFEAVLNSYATVKQAGGTVDLERLKNMELLIADEIADVLHDHPGLTAETKPAFIQDIFARLKQTTPSWEVVGLDEKRIAHFASNPTALDKKMNFVFPEPIKPPPPARPGGGGSGGGSSSVSSKVEAAEKEVIEASHGGTKTLVIGGIVAAIGAGALAWQNRAKQQAATQQQAVATERQ